MSRCSNSSVSIRMPVQVLSIEELAADFLDDSPRPEEQLERKQASRAVEHFVRGLSPRDREIALSLFWHDQSQTALAQRFGVSKMAINKAMARIAKLGRVALAHHRQLADLHRSAAIRVSSC